MAGLKVFDGSSWRAVGVEDSQWDVLTATTNPTSVALSWPTAGGSPTSYEIDIDGTIIDVGNVTSYERTGLTPNQQYRFKVRPKYSDGSTGGWTFFKDRTPTGFNSATGGTIVDVSDYNGSGETWRVHTFSSNGNFVVSNSPLEFRVLLVGGGGSQGSGGTYGGGGAGGMVERNNFSITQGEYPIVVGSGGTGTRNKGQDSSAFSLIALGGGAGGSDQGGNQQIGCRGGSGGGPGAHGQSANDGNGGGLNDQPGSATGGFGNRGGGSQGANSTPTGGGGGGAGGAGSIGGFGAGRSNNITGSSVVYAEGGSPSNQARTASTGAGRGGGRNGVALGGIVIISYRIA